MLPDETASTGSVARPEAAANPFREMGDSRVALRTLRTDPRSKQAAGKTIEQANPDWTPLQTGDLRSVRPHCHQREHQ